MDMHGELQAIFESVVLTPCYSNWVWLVSFKCAAQEEKLKTVLQKIWINHEEHQWTKKHRDKAISNRGWKVILIKNCWLREMNGKEAGKSIENIRLMYVNLWYTKGVFFISIYQPKRSQSRMLFNTFFHLFPIQRPLPYVPLRDK